MKKNVYFSVRYDPAFQVWIGFIFFFIGMGVGAKTTFWVLNQILSQSILNQSRGLMVPMSKNKEFLSNYFACGSVKVDKLPHVLE